MFQPPEMTSATGKILPDQKCCVCHYEFDAATCIGSDVRPRPGDFSICLKCGEIMVFGHDFMLRQPSLLELNQIQQDGSLAWKQLEKAQQLIRKTRPLDHKL